MTKTYDPIMCMMVDEPAKAQDAKKEDGFKILNAVVRGEKLVLTFEDLLNSPGKKETMEFTKKEAEAFKKDPWNTWTGNTKSVVEKFIGGKVQDSASALDEAIKTCDAASGDAMKQIASTAKAWTKQYNQLFEKATTEEEVNKLKSQSDNDYRRALDNLDKIYNEVSQAYGYARNEVRSLFDEVGSIAFKAYRRVTQK